MIYNTLTYELEQFRFRSKGVHRREPILETPEQ